MNGGTAGGGRQWGPSFLARGTGMGGWARIYASRESGQFTPGPGGGRRNQLGEVTRQKSDQTSTAGPGLQVFGPAWAHP